MTANDGNSSFSLEVSIRSEDARGFLQRLATDAKFYKRFQDNPKSVLKRIPGVDLDLPPGRLLPRGVKPPSRKQIQVFVKTGFPPPSPNPPPYNGGCLVWSVLYGIASQTEAEDTSGSS